MLAPLRSLLVVAVAVWAIGCESTSGLPESTSPTPAPTAPPSQSAPSEVTPPLSPDAPLPSVDRPPIDEEARRAALAGDSMKVERILLPRLRDGGVSSAEARLLYVACKNNGSRACIDEVKAKHPDARPRGSR